MKQRTATGIAFAVCACVAIGLFIYSTYGGRDGETAEGIRVFDSYAQIEKTLREIKDEDPMIYANGMTTIEEDAEVSSAPDAAAGIATAKDSGHSETYIQVEGVDEADIVKTDGNYIYYTSRLGYDVIIAEVSGGKAKDAAVISEEETGISAEELFLTDGRLIVVGTEYKEPKGMYDPTDTLITAACVYDVSDPTRPKIIGTYRQSGSYVSSRITDGHLYLVTTDYLTLGDQRIVPSAGTDKSFEKLAPDHVCCFPDPAKKAYAVIGAVKVSAPKGKLKSETRAVLGASGELYCSGNAVYLTDYRFSFRDQPGAGSDERTVIIKAEISKGNIAFAKEGSVRGRVNNQFSMDERDGMFRIATTAFIKGKDVNCLYILDENLETVGKVRGFAGGEQIKAVRFLEDTAYVITYEQTDPLFVIDLRDPKTPEILGSVEITGFSSLLIPEEGDQLIGIGFSTSEEEFGEVEDGIKIALFDVSDPVKPEVLDSKTYQGFSSDVQYDHRALTVNSREGWYAIPYDSWEDETGGVLQFRAADGKLKELGNYEGEKGISRCLFTGGYIYGLETNEDRIVSWKLTETEE